MEEKPKRRGRPTKPPEGDGRVAIGLRVTADMKRRLDEAAARSGRSLSQEVELRIERSTNFEALYGGPDVTALVNMMAGAFVRGGQRAAREMGRRKPTPAEWVDDPACYEAGMYSVVETLVEFKPHGEVRRAFAEAVRRVLTESEDKVLKELEARRAKVQRVKKEKSK